jgi:hypothetical protein
MMRAGLFATAGLIACLWEMAELVACFWAHAHLALRELSRHLGWTHFVSNQYRTDKSQAASGEQEKGSVSHNEEESSNTKKK